MGLQRGGKASETRGEVKIRWGAIILRQSNSLMAENTSEIKPGFKGKENWYENNPNKTSSLSQEGHSSELGGLGETVQNT